MNGLITAMSGNYVKLVSVLVYWCTVHATQVLNKWFEGEALKAALATDAIIGAMLSPYSPGSGYVAM